ncbi:MAG: DinB family protein [Ignavibacteriaceae bacterium]
MYHKLEDFINDWVYESEATLKVFNNLTDESLTKNVGENVRTAGRLAWHITTSVIKMSHRIGLTFEAVDENFPAPEKAQEIYDTYKAVSEMMIAELKEKWTDETLLIEDDMFGENWKRGTTLGVIITHQIHHRAQLTVVMRLAGLKVPGVYGPAKEEWAQYGMAAQD